ncbi:carboxyl transferase domain-containing protein [Streptomyces sp. Tu 2975]|uniref:carboxyl transferase domain-containing protein n=1 Tax=Streptomyces sp. Tu 2975 TaxID=2676871 RepID=UPI001FC95F92|nr:carboxyl transferase domain-containing protein [Streptomyces sp. Tu 2975]
MLKDIPPTRADRRRGRVAELQALHGQAVRGPSERATEAQHAKGKLTARERIALLLDEGSFREVEQLRRHRASGFGLEAKKPYTDGVITGWGRSRAGRCSSTRMISGSSVVRWVRRMPRRSTRSWTWRSRRVRRWCR